MSNEEILTDDEGHPFEKPFREDFNNLQEYVEALYAYRDQVAACANESFDKAFRTAIKK